MKKRIKTFLLICLLGLVPLLGLAKSETKHALLLNYNGAIGPATEDYIVRGIDKAARENATIIVLELDTPGGLSSSMRKIIKAILASPVPFVTYVSPSGARAASAGMYIAYASHIAAMAPGTNIGAATPVQMGGLPFLPQEEDQAKPTNKKDNQPGAEKQPDASSTPKTAMEKKVINDAAAYIRGLATLRGRNSAWAQKAVFDGVSVSAEEALKLNVIDVVATNVTDLLTEINGKTVNVLGNKEVLHTQHVSLQTYAPDWRNRFLQVITNPNVAYILLIIGFYGLVFEFFSPGAIVPGVVGGISFLIGLYALQLLPINYAGLGLILLGIGFMIGEVFVSSFGILGLGGVVSFVVGSILLLDTGVPEFNIAWWVIISVSALSAGFFLFIIAMAFRSSRRPVVIGKEELVGQRGMAITDIDKTGRVLVAGEDWKAFAKTAIKKGQAVEVIRVEGLELWVKPHVDKVSNHQKSGG